MIYPANYSFLGYGGVVFSLEDRELQLDIDRKESGIQRRLLFILNQLLRNLRNEIIEEKKIKTISTVTSDPVLFSYLFDSLMGGQLESLIPESPSISIIIKFNLSQIIQSREKEIDLVRRYIKNKKLVITDNLSFSLVDEGGDMYNDVYIVISGSPDKDRVVNGVHGTRMDEKRNIVVTNALPEDLSYILIFGNFEIKDEKDK